MTRPPKRTQPPSHFNGKTFFQPGGNPTRSFWDVLRWQWTRHAAPWPSSVPLVPQPPPPAPRGEGMVLTYIGHATCLLQTARGNFIFDPMFSERASPFPWIGPKRVQPPGMQLADIPALDAVLISHDHYDHCDLPTLRAIAAKQNPLFLAPLRHGDVLAHAQARRVAELDWWQESAVGGATVTLTPAKHWCNRLRKPRNFRLWGGFFLKIGARSAWFAGDTGYDQQIFREICSRCGTPDLALLPIGAYEPRWFMAPMHMNPAEAVAAHRDVGARRSVAIHWGTFRLTDEAFDAPVQALAVARAEAGMSETEFGALATGESVVV